MADIAAASEPQDLPHDDDDHHHDHHHHHHHRRHQSGTAKAEAPKEQGGGAAAAAAQASTSGGSDMAAAALRIDPARAEVLRANLAQVKARVAAASIGKPVRVFFFFLRKIN